jgi:hypothetical protein
MIRLTILSLASLLAFGTHSAPAFADEREPAAAAPEIVSGATASTGLEQEPDVATNDFTSENAEGQFMSVRFSAGEFFANSNSQLKHESTGIAAGLALHLYPKRAVSYRFELIGASRRYDAPVMTQPTDDPRVSLDTTAMLFGVRLAELTDRPYRFHITGGVGFFKNDMTQTGYNFGLPGVVREQSVTSFGYHAGAGVEIDRGDWVFGLDYEHWFAQGSLDAFGLHNIDLGGNYVGLNFGRYF